jgi:hypothetical protein
MTKSAKSNSSSVRLKEQLEGRLHRLSLQHPLKVQAANQRCPFAKTIVVRISCGFPGKESAAERIAKWLMVDGLLAG